MTELTGDQLALWREWVASRPKNLADWLTEHHPNGLPACWRLADTTGHYLLRSFHTQVDEHGVGALDGGQVTVEVIHTTGPGSRLVEGAIGIGVFGVPVEKLVACGCENFSSLL